MSWIAMPPLPLDDEVVRTFAQPLLAAGLCLWDIDRRHGLWFVVGTTDYPACRIDFIWAYSPDPENIAVRLAGIAYKIKREQART